MITQYEAREIDEALADMRPGRQRRLVGACRLAYLMAQQGYRILGFGSFAGYLRNRQIPLSWAYMLRDLYGKLVVELGRPESSWCDIPLSRLRLCLSILTRENVNQVLHDARTLSRVEYKRMVKAAAGRQAPQGTTLLPGTYRLVPAELPSTTLGSGRRVQGSVYASPDDSWYVDVRE